ncbi:MAG: hypothetical protein R2685_16310 [Candidatus Nitrosocosmicus sp.]|nr:hypothetical protein [Candidatus Nitrosocosmicus sp.]
MSDVIIIKPHKVGSKNSNSLAIGIPSLIREKNHITTSTVFLMKSIDSGILLQYIDINNKKIPANQSLETSEEQVSIA